jgi:hypothetical protein
MSKDAEYRSFAASCLEIANKTSDTASKARLLATAEAWLDLADRVSPGETVCLRNSRPSINFKHAAPVRWSGDEIDLPQLPGPSVKFIDYASPVARCDRPERINCATIFTLLLKEKRYPEPAPSKPGMEMDRRCAADRAPPRADEEAPSLY